MEAVYTTDDSRFKYVFCYTDTALPLDSYVTIGGFTTRMSKVYTSADGWNPSIGQPTQGVIGFNYDNISTFIYGQPFYINNSTGSYPVSGYLSQTDAVAAQLTTSLTTYTNTLPNYWIEVTQTEYQNIANNINGVVKSGFSDGYLPTATVASHLQSYEDYWTNFFGGGPRIPAGYAMIGLAAGVTSSSSLFNVKSFNTINGAPCNINTLTQIGNNSINPAIRDSISYFIIKQPTSFVAQGITPVYLPPSGLFMQMLTNNSYNDFLMNGIPYEGGCYSHQYNSGPITQSLAINRIVWPT